MHTVRPICSLLHKCYCTRASSSSLLQHRRETMLNQAVATRSFHTPMVTRPTFDLHAIENALRGNHVLFGGTPLNELEITLSVQAYREFLYQHKLVGMPEQFEVPSLQVDRVWHTHMVETRQYAADCDEYFGRMLHHSDSTCLKLGSM